MDNQNRNQNINPNPRNLMDMSVDSLNLTLDRAEASEILETSPPAVTSSNGGNLIALNDSIMSTDASKENNNLGSGHGELRQEASVESNEETSTTSSNLAEVVDSNIHEDQQQDIISTTTKGEEEAELGENGDNHDEQEPDNKQKVDGHGEEKEKGGEEVVAENDKPTSITEIAASSTESLSSVDVVEEKDTRELEKVEVLDANVDDDNHNDNVEPSSSHKQPDQEIATPVVACQAHDEIKKSPSIEELKLAKTLVEDTIEQVISSKEEGNLQRQSREFDRELSKHQQATRGTDSHQETIDCVESSFQTASGDETSDPVNYHNIIKDNNNENENKYNMEFTKNYSDDLLMGQDGGAGSAAAGPGGELADFELPQFSSSSSGSEGQGQAKQQEQTPSPTKRKSSASGANTSQASSSSQVTGAAPDLTAVKNLLISSYSKVSHLFHWTKPIETGLIFAIGSSLILALTFFSIISVVAYTALGIILSSSLIRIYKMAMKTLNRSQDTPFDHIWDKVLSLDVNMSPEKLHRLVDSSHNNINSSLVYFKQVLLVQDKFSTLKFALFLYVLTYIGAWFNGLTIITMSYLALFTVPIFYDKNKTKIDEYLNLASSQMSCVTSLVTSKVSALIGGGSDVSKKQK